MSSPSVIICGPCGYEDNTKNAKKWCTNCEEGFCEDCEKVHTVTKMSSDHKFISIEDYRKIEKVSVSLDCDDHGKKLEWFCKTHDSTVCVACVSSKHETCSDVVPLGDAARNAKRSSEVRKPAKGNIPDIHLQLKQRFRIKKKNEADEFSGCIILPNGEMLISYFGNKQLIKYNEKGEHIHDIPVSGQPYDLTVIDSHRIGVSYDNATYIEIFSIKTNKAEKKITLEDNCWGISYQNGKLYVVVFRKGIVVVDLTGKTVDTLNLDVDFVYNITTTRDRIYYTDECKNTVHCCRMTGEAIWVFNDDSVVKPGYLSIDHSQNVFVVGMMSNNLTVIQHDGKKCKTVLTSDDELIKPDAVYYNKEKQILLLCNSASCKASLYTVLYD